MLNKMWKIFQYIIIWDYAVNNWVIKNQNKQVRNGLGIITCFGSGYTWIFLYSLFFILGTVQIRDIILSIIIAEFLGLIIIIVLRNFIRRERPRMNINSLIPLPWNKYSFPSHHALRAVLLATICGENYDKLFPFFICFALIISLSRVYLQKHYFFDVIAGAFIGFLSAWLVYGCLLWFVCMV